MRFAARAGVALLVALLLSGALVAAPAIAAPPDDDCPQFMATADVRAGMAGIGYTVAEGRTMRTFTFTTLGTLPNAIGPGRDMIIVELTGSLVDTYGGAWAGMSGSPLYVDGKLLGALAFAVSFSSAKIVGITPAEEMYKVLEYPDAAGSAGAQTQNADRSLPSRIPISRALRSKIAAATGRQVTEVATSFKQLPIPFSVSGASPQVMKEIAAAVDREKLPLIPYAGSATSSVTAAHADHLHGGDNIVAVLSYGDITSAGTGTVTFACDGRLMAFGHPFLWQGDTLMGAHAGTTIAVVQDPFGSFEMASIDEAVGAIDQDRYAGIRGTLGVTPARIPITSSVQALNNGRSRDGQTDVLVSDMVPSLVFGHVYSNIQMTMDQYTKGTAAVSWTIRGTKSNGEEWSLARDNVHASQFAISDDAVFEISDTLYAIFSNRFEDVEFTGVDFDATVDDEVQQYTINRVLVAAGSDDFSKRQQVRARPGTRIRLRVLLEPSMGTETKTIDLSVRVPQTAASDGFLELSGGVGSLEQGGDVCLYDPSACRTPTGKKVESFEELLEVFGARPKNNELVANLLLGASSKVKASDTEVLDQVVAGAASIYVRIPFGGGGGGRGGAVATKPF